MATSQNGWPVVTSGSSPSLVAIPKVIGRVRKGDVATIMAYIVDRFDREVEDVDAGRDDWGYAYRAIRGQSSGYSNHASGTAQDLNATQHPRGVRNTFTAAQKRKVHAMLSDLDNVVRWGEDYTIGPVDGMHFEINASAAKVKAVADKIRAGKLGTSSASEDYSGTYIERVQSMLKELGHYKGAIDGSKGPATTAAVRAFQKDQGLKQDGEPGSKTYEKLQEETEMPTASEIAKAVVGYTMRPYTYDGVKVGAETLGVCVKNTRKHVIRLSRLATEVTLLARRNDIRTKGIEAAVKTLADNQGVDGDAILKLIAARIDEAIPDSIELEIKQVDEPTSDEEK